MKEIILFSILIIVFLIVYQIKKSRAEDIQREYGPEEIMVDDEDDKFYKGYLTHNGVKFLFKSKDIEIKFLNYSEGLFKKWSQTSGTLVSESHANWYFDEATELQIKRLKEDGIVISKGKLNKGQYSDLISLLSPPNESDLIILKFFKIDTKGLNELEASSMATEIFKNAENKEAWDNRPMTKEQKYFFEMIGSKLDRKKTYLNAKQAINAFINDYSYEFDEDDERLEGLTKSEIEDFKRLWDSNYHFCEEWEAFLDILDDLDDADNRELYEIKKVSFTQLKLAMHNLLAKGISRQDMRDDIDLLVQECISCNPKLER